jgi:hypothetical protein
VPDIDAGTKASTILILAVQRHILLARSPAGQATS